MEDRKPETVARSVATASGSIANPALPSAAAVRHRMPQHQSRAHEASPSPRRPPVSPLARRRSSLLSYSSFEDLRQAFTEDIVDPRTNSTRARVSESEVTHWHSTPLAFAFLPALGGLFFTNGKTFTSDFLLLGLAAVFLNWSIRLPWDWYYSAQSLRRDIEPETSAASEDTADEAAVETASSVGDSPVLSPQGRRGSPAREAEGAGSRRDIAAAHLRTQESLALAATFLFPVAAAFLLHFIRAQLSTSSTGLVSDYNLSIFLLAAEIRPCRQVIRLVASRTLHLQRTVAGTDDAFLPSGEDKGVIGSLARRVAELEARVGEDPAMPSSAAVAQKADVSDLSLEMRKRYEPRLEGLERAVRRYEKRSTTMAITVEQRLQSLEHRIQEALSLAAVAAQHSTDRGATARLLDTISKMLIWPVRTAWNICMSPLLLLEDLYAKVKAVLLGTTTSRPNRRKNVKVDGLKGAEGSREKAAVRRTAK